MAARNRVEKRNMVALEARQTQASSASKKMFPTPTVKIALSTAFAGPKSCADNLLTMLPPPFYNIRANEPVPVENNTVAACYPTEFLQSYTAVTVNVTLPSTVTSTLSSIVPAMSPLACPQNWCTALAGRNNYIVCCPSNYQFHLPDTTVDPLRPYYGGECYSDMKSGSGYSMLSYNTNGDIGSLVMTMTTSGTQALAHPIDGWALTAPTALGCQTTSSTSSGLVSNSSSSSAQASSTSAPASAKTQVSAGVIAGAVVGGVLAVAAIVGLIFFLLMYRRKNQVKPTPPPEINEKDSDYISTRSKVYRHEATPGTVIARHEANSAFAPSELDTTYPTEKNMGLATHDQVNDGFGAFEMPAEQYAEMDAGTDGKLSHDSKSGLTMPPPVAEPKNRSSLAKILDKHDKERMARMGNWKGH